ncbi:MAG TPA: nucleotidyltransferase family protein [Candidatus Methylomirabilis sp.]|nr:nucleotidyltransferase family protein [Candidatus Methylomirabilis sp.]
MRATPPYLGPEERQLILNCARLDLDGHLMEQTEELLHKPLAWDAILFFAGLHSVGPLLYRNLKRFEGANTIPREARRTLLCLSHRPAYQNRQFSRALHDLLEVFARGGIPVIVLKGLSLVELIYRNLSLRPLIDINLLIPRERLEKARGLLWQGGYVMRLLDPSRGRSFSQLKLTRPGNFRVNLLLQWHPVNWPRIHAIDLRRFWEEAQPARLSGQDALIPSPIDLVLYLCLLPDRHGFLNIAALDVEDPKEFVFTEWTENRLIRFTDIRETIRHHQATIDWSELVERAKAIGIEGSVYASLIWITTLFGPTVEPWVVEALRPPACRHLRRRLYEALSGNSRDHKTHAATNGVARSWWMKQRKRTQIRLTHLLLLFEFAFPSRHELRVLYRLDSNKGTFGIYVLHVANSLVVGILPWIYRVLTKRKPPAISAHGAPSRAGGRS